GYDGCDVGIVTNVSKDHLGQKGIDTLEDLARVKQVVIDAVERDGTAVLNAQDRLVAAMAADTDARVIYFSLEAEHPVIRSHLAAGGDCVVVRDGAIVMESGGMPAIHIADLSSLAFALGGK